MNGDGIDDLVIGDESVDRDITESSAKLSEDGHPLDRPGAVYVLYGPLDSSIATLDLATPVPEAGEVVMFGAREGWPYNGGNANGIGRTVALGDVNQDGYDELMFGATSQNTALDWAILYQFPGSPFKPGIPTGNGSFVHLDPLIAPIGSWNETRLGWHEAPTDGTRKGDAAWGDVSGDGRDDFVDNFAYVLLGYMGGFRVVPTPEIAPGERLLPPTLVEPHSLGDSLIESTGGSVDKYISQQDIDGDGETDVVLCNGPAPAWFLVALSDGGAPSAMAVERYTGGKTAMRGFGGRLSPVLRVNIGFEDGQAGAVTATLNKSGNGITNIPEVYVGPTDCYWHLTTDRVGYTQANLLFRYIESDLLGLPDDALVLLTAPTLAGPWNPVARQQLNAYGRRVSAQVSSLGYFTLAYLAADETDAGPRVKEIACDTCTDNPDNPGEETMTVRFAQAVTGVDESDFAVHAPASVGGEILEVHGTGKEYKVRVALGIGVGPVVFEVLDDDSIRDIRDRPLGGPGAGNGSAQRETCAEINIPVSVDRIDADDPSPNALPIVSYTVHFTAPVSGVDIADFELDVNELDRVFFESISGTGDTYHVGVYTGKGSGTIRLRLRDDDTILDASGTPLGGQGTGNGDAQGPTYVILRDETDLVPPTVRGITRASVSPTSAVSVDFYVEFTEDVVGVELSDFEVVTTGGISGAAITGIRGDALVSVITVSTGDGDGTIQLRLHDDDSIVDLASNPLGGAGIGNGDFLNGHVYTIYKSDPGALPPVVSSITRLDASPTDAFTVRYRVRFSEPVTNVDAGDFVTTTAGLLGSSVDSVTGAGDDYTVTVDTGNGAGTLRLDVRDNDSIFDADRNPLGGIGNDNGHFTSGEVYEILRETMMSVRSVKNNATVLPGGPLKVKWTSGPIGNHVRIELWKSGERVAILEKKTKNDGSQNVAIPGNVAEGGGYIIRVVSTSNSAYFSNMKKPFTIE
ncbi:MAG: hypothetical protein HUU46_23765 [Candidatus Hydrogenedentes bacterium]|nr:hypothetical protein [Candidatus Hydrogenedentota bacterium]